MINLQNTVLSSVGSREGKESSFWQLHGCLVRLRSHGLENLGSHLGSASKYPLGLGTPFILFGSQFPHL